MIVDGAGLDKLADRFGSISVDARKPNPSYWPKRWRARGPISANRTAEAWGDTLEIAVRGLIEAIEIAQGRLPS